VVVDRHRQRPFIGGRLRRERDVLDHHVTERLDRVGDAPRERRHIALTLAIGVGLADVKIVH
jgi:hypothetical protein